MGELYVLSSHSKALSQPQHSTLRDAEYFSSCRLAPFGLEKNPKPKPGCQMLQPGSGFRT